MIQAIILDCFGVLVGRGFNETYRIAGGDPVKDRQFIVDLLGETNLGTISEDEFHARLTKQLGISLEQYERAVFKAEQPDPQLLEYVATLHKTYKTAILSNANVGVLERKIDPAVLATNFDALVVSGEIGVVKPDPRIYELAAEKLGVEPQACVFTDDYPSYCEAARDVGMQAIHYQNFEQFRADLEKILA